MFIQEGCNGALGGMDCIKLFVSKCESESDDMILQYVVHQGSVLGPRICTQYVKDACGWYHRINSLSLRHHLFADDMHCYTVDLLAKFL